MRPSIKDVGNLVGGGFNKFLEICHQGEVGTRVDRYRKVFFVKKSVKMADFFMDCIMVKIISVRMWNFKDSGS